MNWTGGRLHRVSRANAKTTRKLHREHFVRAKLQARTVQKPLSPLCLSFAQAPYDRTGPVNTPQDEEKIEHSGSPPRRKYPSAALIPANTAERSDQARHIFSVNPPPDNASPPRSTDPATGAEDRTIDHVKQQLLKNSDWLGLTVSKPPKYQFAPPEEMDKLGRRKIWRSGARRRKEQLQVAHQAKSRLRNAQDAQDERRLLVRPDESISIRFGSNIHGTQTSAQERTQPQHTPSVKSSATESMILDQYEGVEAANPFRIVHLEESPVLRPREYDRAEASRKSPPVILPLNEVRDLETFDQIKARSESLTRDLSSRQLGLSSHQSPVQIPGVNQHSRAPSLRTKAEVQPTTVAQRRIESSPRSKLSTSISYRTDPGSQAKSPVHSTPTGTPTTVGTLEDKRTGQVSVSSQGNIESRNVERDERYTVDLTELDSRVPRFTVDQQVEVELVSQVDNKAIPFTDRQESLQQYEPGNEEFHRIAARNRHERLKLRVPRLPSSQSIAADHRNHVQDLRPEANSRDEVYVGQEVLLPQSGTNYAEPNTAASTWSIYSPETSIEPASPTHPTEDYETSRQRLKSDDHEKWPDFAFADGPKHPRAGYNFTPSPVRSGPDLAKRNLTIYSSSQEYGGLHATPYVRNSSPHIAGPSPSKTFQTSANTTLFRPAEDEELGDFYDAEQSETDFLTNLSPMEGHINEHFEQLSVHNNPARTEKSYIPLPSTTNKIERLSAPLGLLSRSARNCLPLKARKLKRYGAESTKVPLFSTPQRLNKSRPEINGQSHGSSRSESVAASSEVLYRDFAYEIEPENRNHQDTQFRTPVAREQPSGYTSASSVTTSRRLPKTLIHATIPPRTHRPHERGGLDSLPGSAASVQRQATLSSSYFAISPNEQYQHSPASASWHLNRPPPPNSRSHHFPISHSSSTSQATPAGSTLKRPHQHHHVTDSTRTKRAKLFQDQPIHTSTHSHTTTTEYPLAQNVPHHRQTLDDFRPFIGEYLRSKGL